MLGQRLGSRKDRNAGERYVSRFRVRVSVRLFVIIVIAIVVVVVVVVWGRGVVSARARVRVNMRITFRVCISVRFARASAFYDLTAANERWSYAGN